MEFPFANENKRRWYSHTQDAKDHGTKTTEKSQIDFDELSRPSIFASNERTPASLPRTTHPQWSPYASTKNGSVEIFRSQQLWLTKRRFPTENAGSKDTTKPAAFPRSRASRVVADWRDRFRDGGIALPFACASRRLPRNETKASQF
jgi:hypothetical protein